MLFVMSMLIMTKVHHLRTEMGGKDTIIYA